MTSTTVRPMNGFSTRSLIDKGYTQFQLFNARSFISNAYQYTSHVREDKARPAKIKFAYF